MMGHRETTRCRSAKNGWTTFKPRAVRRLRHTAHREIGQQLHDDSHPYGDNYCGPDTEFEWYKRFGDW